MLVGSFGTVALGIGHRNAKHQIFVLHLMHIIDQTLVIVGAFVGIQTMGRLVNRVKRVLGQVTLGTAGVLANQTHGFEFVQEIAGRSIDMVEAIDLAAGAFLGRHHQWLI